MLEEEEEEEKEQALYKVEISKKGSKIMLKIFVVVLVSRIQRIFLISVVLCSSYIRNLVKIFYIRFFAIFVEM